MSQHAAESEFCNVTAAARYLGYDPSTVWKWIKAGTLDAFKTPSGRTLVRRKDLLKLRRRP